MRRLFYLIPVVCIAAVGYAQLAPDKATCDAMGTPFDLTHLAGYQIAFAAPRAPGGAENQDIWTVSPDGTSRRNLTGHAGQGVDIYPEWAPDGAYLYYTSNKHGGNALELYRVTTTGAPIVERLSDFGRELRSLSVSPDNRHILLSLMTAAVPLGQDLSPYSSDLYVLPMEILEKRLAQGQLLTVADLRLLLREDPENHIWHEQPDWQPGTADEASVILYTRTQNYDLDAIMVDEIWQTRLDGSVNAPVFVGDSMPRWTADGTRFVTHQFQYVEFDTGHATKLQVHNIASDAGSASLAPTGDYLVFEANDTARQAGIAPLLETGETVRFTCLSNHPSYEPRWSPVPVKPAP